MLVVKRDGEKVELDYDKIHRVVNWACDGLSGVSASDVQLNARLKFYTGIKTSEIQETLIRSAADLISEDNPNYQYVASRLIQYDLYKKVFGSIRPKSLYDVVSNGVAAGYYTKELLDWYSEEEFQTLNSFIDHERDNDIVFAGMELYRTKYLVRNRVTKQIYETPQIALMLISMVFFHRYIGNDRMRMIRDFYDSLSTFEISLPTPIMAGLRTPQKQFSSCVLIESDDSLDSINATSSSIVKYVANRAGIGIQGGKIRGIGSAIRNGDTTHTGVISFWKHFYSAVASCNQGGLRKGSANMNFPGWHQEFSDLIVLKNNKGTDETRIRELDYTIQLSRLFYERLVSGGDITFFSPSDVPGLYDAFYENEDKFKQLYEKYEKDRSIRKSSMPAFEFFSTIAKERKDTGRIYIMNVDHCNEHGSFIPELAPIRMTNLCVEVTLPTKPLEHIFDEEGAIALCTLSAINWGKIKSPEQFEKPAKLLVTALDELLDYQSYPIAAARLETLRRRTLGIGIVGFAHWMAKNGISYQNPTPEQLDLIDTWSQAWSYYLLKASVDLAREKGPCELISQTKYAGGILPIDTYKKEVDELVPHSEKMPWGSLRADMSDYGIRNSTLMALMPAETSALISNATNGIEPIRALVVTKGNKDSLSKQVAPEIRKLAKSFDLLWDQRSPRGYLSIVAILTKYLDMAASTNTSYNPKFYPDGVSDEDLIGDILFAYRYGIKTLYYSNLNDDAGEIDIDEEEDCEGCKL